jgi:hypothetical protein
LFKSVVILPAFCLSFCALQAGAAEVCASPNNLVQNCGFETGDFSGWTVSGDTANAGVDSFDAHTGSFGAFLAGFGSFNAGDTNYTFVEQTLATTPGREYTLSYFTAHFTNANVTPDNVFAAGIDNLLIPSSLQVNVANVPYTGSAPYSFKAGSSSTLLSFLAEDANFDFSLDDVSVVASPEPASFWLVAPVLGVLALFWRGKRRTRTICRS